MRGRGSFSTLAPFLFLLAGCGSADDLVVHAPGADAAHDAPVAANDAGASDATAGPDAATDAADGSAHPPDAGDASAPTGPLVAYVSGYSPTIAAYQVDEHTGALAAKGTTASFGQSPSFLAISRDVTHLFALDEATQGQVGAYAIDGKTFALTFLNAVSSGGNGPAYVAVDATGKQVLVANYGDGTVSVIPVQANGHLGTATVSGLAVGANAHMAAIDPSNHFVFVPCKGADYVAQFHFDAAAGTLTPNTPAHVATAAGAGPRHLAFHPTAHYAYLIAENASTLTTYALDPVQGTLSSLQTVTTLPAGFTGTNTGAEVWVHPSGKFVFASNRGDDSIATFSIDAGTGKVSLLGHTKTGGMTPRDFSLDPAGSFLYAANQGSNDVVPFLVGASGALSTTAAPVTATGASFVGVVRFPAQ